MMDVHHCLNASNLFNMQRGSACATMLFLCQVFILISQIARFLLQSAWQTPPDFQISRVHLTAICSSLQQCTGQDHVRPKYFFPQISDFKVTNIFIFFSRSKIHLLRRIASIPLPPSVYLILYAFFELSTQKPSKFFAL